MRPCEIDDLAVLSRQMVPVSGISGKVLINLVNFDLVNSDFSFNFLTFTQFNHILSDLK